MHPFEERWPKLVDDYGYLRARAEAGVQRWAWAHGDAALHVREPLHAERLGARPRGLLTKAPKRQVNVMEYGYETDELVVVARRYGAFGNRHDEFFFPEGDRVESVRYAIHPLRIGSSDTYIVPERFSEHVFEAGRSKEYRAYHGANGWTCERYVYQDGVLVQIDTVYRRADGEQRELWSVSYDRKGQVSQIRDEVTETVVFAHPR